MLLQIPNDSNFQSAIDSDASLLTIIGFLEACVPRMIELIQAGSVEGSGFVSEETLVTTLEVNDELCMALKDLNDPIAFFQRQRSTSGANNGGGGKIAAVGSGNGLEAEFDAFGIIDDGITSNQPLATPQPPQDNSMRSTTSSTLDDLLTLSTDGMTTTTTTTGVGGGAAKAMDAQTKDDDFDNFFK